MGIHEECGVFGVLSAKKENVAELVYYGLYALQHRGQESCGIVVNDDGVFSSYKDLGLVSEDVFKGYPGSFSRRDHGGGPCEIWDHRRKHKEQLPAH